MEKPGKGKENTSSHDVLQIGYEDLLQLVE